MKAARPLRVDRRAIERRLGEIEDAVKKVRAAIASSDGFSGYLIHELETAAETLDQIAFDLEAEEAS